MSETIPTPEEICQVIKNILLVHPFWVAVSTGIRDTNPGTSDKSVVVYNQGDSAEAIEAHLNERGVAVEIALPFHFAPRDQSGGEIINDVSLLVRLKVNPKRNFGKNGAKMSILRGYTNIVVPICRYGRSANSTRGHPGGEFFKQGEAVLSQDDPGAVTYEITFTKENVSI